MILEELVGTFLSLFSTVITQAPAISHENLQNEFEEETPEQDAAYDGLIHREYDVEQPTLTDLPYDADESDDRSRVAQADEQTRRTVCESFLRSLKANIGIIIVVVFLLALFTVAGVLLGLKITDYCGEWIPINPTLPRDHDIVKKIIAISIILLPLYFCFPACIAMSFGYKEFKKHYLVGLFFFQLVMWSVSTVYQVYFFDQFATGSVDYDKYRFPLNAIFVFSLLCGAYLVARKCKKVNLTTSYSVFRIWIVLFMPFAGFCFFGLTYRYVVIKYFRETEDRTKRAVIAALTPGFCLPLIAVAKYLAMRKSSEIIKPDRAYALCYFLRGAMIILYRILQSNFQNLWLFAALSLLRGVSNVLSQATLNLRIKVWTFLIKWYNHRICCGPRLKLRPLNTPRIRRFNADLEIQDILFQYTTVIVSQAYLSCFILMNFDVPPWQVIKGCLVRTALSFAIDFVFNAISMFIQIHYHDIPMRNVWTNYWLRHVAANAVITIVIIDYFGGSLLGVFSGLKSTLKIYRLKNCTSVI